MNWTASLAAAAALGLTAPLSVVAHEEQNHEAVGMSREEVLKTTTNMIGEPVTFPTGAVEITTEMLTFEPGGHTSLHQHPVPSWVYVLEGELEVRVDGQEPMRFTPGQTFLEPQDTTMQAFNVAEGPTRLLVVSIGAEGQPTGQPIVAGTE